MRGRRALLASDCLAGSANATGACEACAVGSYAPGSSAVATLTESPACFLADTTNGLVEMTCAFASTAPALAAAPAGEAAACVFAKDIMATSNNCTLRYVYAASTFATVADCVFGDALRSALNNSNSDCIVLGSGGTLYPEAPLLPSDALPRALAASVAGVSATVAWGGLADTCDDCGAGTACAANGTVQPAPCPKARF